MTQVAPISADFPFQSHFQTVFDYKMHYVEAGSGDPILFLHGMPTSSYLWRNIIPSLAKQGRCIALDLMGMGLSDKPDISYHVFDHIAYVEGFIEAMGLKNVTLVMHGWGSTIGFDYAMRNETNIKGLAFFESHFRPVKQRDLVSLPVQQWTDILKNDGGGFDAVMTGNYFISKVLPWGCLRQLTDAELAHYQKPFVEPGTCRVLWQYLEDLPLGDGSPSRVVSLIENYSDKLQQSQLPKLLMYAVPGFITPISHVQWAKQSLPNLTVADLGDALHYAQESQPAVFSEHLLNWYTNLA